MNPIEEAIYLVENGQIEEGLDIINKLKESCSDEEKFAIGELLYNWGYLEEAKDIFEDLLRYYPNEGDILILLAEIYIDLEEEEKAIQLLEDIDEHDQAFVRSLLLLADLYQIQGLYEVSERKLIEAKRVMPDEHIIDFALAELYLSLGEYNKSLTFYKNVLKACEMVGNVNINQRIAECLTATGEFEDALIFYDKAIQEKYEINTLFEYGFTAFHAGYPKTTIDKLTQLKDLDPQYSSLYLYLAKAYEQEGMLKECFTTIQEGINVDDFNKELLLYGGKIAVKLGKSVEAEEFLRSALALDPAYLEAAIYLGEFLRSISKFEEVVELVNEIKQYGDIPPLLEWDLAHAKNKLEFYEDAIKHYRHAYTSLKNNIDFLEEFGYFLLEEGNRSEAFVIFKEMLAIDPSHSDIAEIIFELENELR